MSPPSSHPLNMCVRVQDVAVAEECYTQQLHSYQQLTAQVLCFLFAFRDCWCARVHLRARTSLLVSATTGMTSTLRHFRSESGLARNVVSGAVLAATTAVRTVDGYCNSFTLGH